MKLHGRGLHLTSRCNRRRWFAETLNKPLRDAKLFLCSSVGSRGQALSAQGDLEKAKEELKNAMTVVATAPPEAHAENEHDDEHDENHAEASAELSNEGVSQLDLRSEEARVTEAQKNQRVKQQLQVRVQPARRQSVENDPGASHSQDVNCTVVTAALLHR